MSSRPRRAITNPSAPALHGGGPADMQKRRDAMIGKVTTLGALGALVCAPAWAQDDRFGIRANAGYTLSDRVSSQTTIRAGDGNLYNRLDPKDSFSWGLTLGYHLNEEWELEFLYDQQQSKLQVGGTATRDVGDFKVKNYHGVFS